MANTSHRHRGRSIATGPNTVTGPEREARELAASIDDAAAELASSGPVSSADLRRLLAELEAEWSGDGESSSAKRTDRLAH